MSSANANTIVVLNTGGPTLMPWLDGVKAVLETWYPGVENGNAVAALLFGDVNPSGHLTETFPQNETDIPTADSPQKYPGLPGNDGNVHAVYSEGLLVGYRWYDAKAIEPLFCFGHGLSYTTFGYSGLSVSPAVGGGAQVTFTVKNTGSRAGAAVAQIYVSDPAASGEPPKELGGFEKVPLAPGASSTVSVTLPARAFSYWNNGWIEPTGVYTVRVGSSSCGLPLSAQAALPQKIGGSAGTGNGYLLDSTRHRLSFSFEAKKGLIGKLDLNDDAAKAKIHLDKLTALGPVQSACGQVPESPELDRVPRHRDVQRGEGGGLPGLRAGQREPGKGADLFHLECTAGCAYTTSARAPDEVIDDGNIDVS